MLKLDPDGRYIILHAILDRQENVLVGLYLPPPVSTRLLNQLVAKVVTYSTDNVLIFGDFNMVLDAGMDRLSPVVGAPSELAVWAEASNFTDVWRWLYPLQRTYTCHLETYKTFSSIDFV